MDSVTRCPVNQKLERGHICNTCKYQETTAVNINIQPMNEHMIVYNEPCNSCWRGSLVKDSDLYEDKWEPRPGAKSVADIINEVVTEICDHYCKYPEKYADYEEMLKEQCEDCPLNKLT